MTKKRFTLAYKKGNWWAVRDSDITLWKEEVIDLLNELNDKCEFLEIENESLEDGATNYAELYHKSLKENEQLKQRNDRQAKRLAELYELMAKKDWESLTEIIDDFCSCEEQLQREWRTYE